MYDMKLCTNVLYPNPNLQVPFLTLRDAPKCIIVVQRKGLIISSSPFDARSLNAKAHSAAQLDSPLVCVY
jgi:hypothetical protein